MVFLATGAFAAEELKSMLTSVAPTVDGTIEGLWDQVPEISVGLAGGANSGASTMTIRSMYDADMVYFLFQWTDPTDSQRRFPWVKQKDNSWQQLVSPDNAGGDENVYYEDKMSAIWNIDDSIAGFNDAGCFVTCHVGEGKPFGNKYTASPGEIGDIWHWKGVRNNFEGYIDDQYVDDMRYDPVTVPSAGRHSDPRDSGGYSNNKNEAGDAPAFMPSGGTAPPYYLPKSDAVEFADIFLPGDEIPGIIVERPTGDRGDIDGKGAYAGGMWTLEAARARETGSMYDVQFASTDWPYHFGVATFDNAQVRHSWHAGALALILEGGGTAVEPDGKVLTTWSRIKATY